MGLWNFLSRFSGNRFERLENGDIAAENDANDVMIEDEFFGIMKLNYGDPYYFTGQRYFAPINDVIEFRLNDSVPRETHKQDEFFRKIESRYSQMVEAFAPHIERRIQELIGNFQITDFQKEFKVFYISLPAFQTKPIEWEIEFDVRDKSQGIDFVGVELVDNEIENIYLTDSEGFPM